MGVPKPVIWIAIEPKTTSARDRLAAGLRALTAEDPTIGVRAEPHSDETIVGGMGELHLDVIVDRLKREFNVEATVGKPKVAYKEALTRSADGEMKYARQTGGHGQYSHVKIHLFPGEPGAGYIFENETTGGSIPREFIKPIDDGIRDAVARGAVAGYPIEDVKVVLYDGSFHDVDSSAAAFRLAGAMAFDDAAKRANPIVLEPVMRVEIAVPKEHTADVTGTLLARRGRIQSQEERSGTQMIAARVPLAEMFGYNAALRSRTYGRGTYSMQFDGYERHPGDPHDDDEHAPVRAPLKPAPYANRLGVALPEPDDDVVDG